MRCPFCHSEKLNDLGECTDCGRSPYYKSQFINAMINKKNESITESAILRITVLEQKVQHLEDIIMGFFGY